MTTNRRTGYPQLFRTDQELAASAPARTLLGELGVRHMLIDAAQCRALEPTLHAVTPLAGGIHLPDDETGNCAYFAHQLKDVAIREGVDFRFGVEVQPFDLASGRIEALRPLLVRCGPTPMSLPAVSTARSCWPLSVSACRC